MFFVNLIETHQLKALPLYTEFIDIGIPKDYLKFCKWDASGRIGKL